MKTNKFILVFILLTGSHCGLSQEAISKRVAIVIGIQNYTSIPALRNSLNDARDMSASLRSKGFDVIEVYDPFAKKDIQDGLRKYFNLVKDRNDVAGLIYYSGHGIQVDGSNYLIPVSANPQIKADLDDQCVKMDFVMGVLGEAGNSLNILIMDACRNNPFHGFSRGTERGLSVVDAPKGSYIVYSTKPGSVASDGNGVNGLFTSKLLKYMDEPNLNIEQVFKRVAKEVSEESNDSQRPWISSDYTGDFYFSHATKQASTGEKTIEPTKLKIETATQGRNVVESNINADELYQNSKSLFENGKIAEGLNNLERAANSGHLHSQLDLGQLYRKSNVVAQDYVKSLGWYKKAAEKEDVSALNAVGEFYLNGLGVREDYEMAHASFQKAAAKNSPDAEFNLGLMYLNGRGVPKSELEAIKWFTKAADQNYIPAQNKLGSLYLIGGEEFKRSNSIAIKWFKKAAALGDSWAKETLESMGY